MKQAFVQAIRSDKERKGGKRERKRERDGEGEVGGEEEERRRKSRGDDIQIIPGFVERREKLECFILLTKTWAK